MNQVHGKNLLTWLMKLLIKWLLVSDNINQVKNSTSTTRFTGLKEHFKFSSFDCRVTVLIMTLAISKKIWTFLTKGGNQRREIFPNRKFCFHRNPNNLSTSFGKNWSVYATDSMGFVFFLNGSYCNVALLISLRVFDSFE